MKKKLGLEIGIWAILMASLFFMFYQRPHFVYDVGTVVDTSWPLMVLFMITTTLAYLLTIFLLAKLNIKKLVIIGFILVILGIILVPISLQLMGSNMLYYITGILMIYSIIIGIVLLVSSLIKKLFIKK